MLSYYYLTQTIIFKFMTWKKYDNDRFFFERKRVGRKSIKNVGFIFF